MSGSQFVAQVPPSVMAVPLSILSWSHLLPSSSSHSAAAVDCPRVVLLGFFFESFASDAADEGAWAAG